VSNVTLNVHLRPFAFRRSRQVDHSEYPWATGSVMHLIVALARCPANDQILGSFVLFLRVSQFTLLHGHLGQRRAPIILRFPDLGLNLTQVGLQRFGVHRGYDLAGTDRISFIRKNRLDPARILGRDIDLFAFETAVATGESGGRGAWERYRYVAAPPAYGDDYDRDNDQLLNIAIDLLE
jgi:hypothetical protein